MQPILLENLPYAFIPAFVVIILLYKWNQGFKTPLYALTRMVLQLVMIGYMLVYIFNADSSLMVLAVLTVMLLAASYISLRTVKSHLKSHFTIALISIFSGSVSTLLLITQVVMNTHPWYNPMVMIPLAGMIFSASVDAIAIAIERKVAELKHGKDEEAASADALNASLIPVVNSLFATGLVALPGMMTGQILSGVSPLIAVRYQIMVMAMVFGAAGISVIIFLVLSKKKSL